MPRASRKYDVYQLRLTVRDIEPKIWRVVSVRSDMTLARLHMVIQVLMGWYDYHLYQFQIDGEAHGPPRDDDVDYGYRRSVRISLAKAFGKDRDTISYEYDFGDSWEIDILREAVHPAELQRSMAFCVAGARHGPMEDRGGPFGYQDMLQILKDKQHPDYRQTKQWIGRGFRPEEFELQSTNELLTELERRNGNRRVLAAFWPA